MNLVKTENLTMDSLEIARLTNKEHRNVTRDIEKMFEELEIDVLKFEHIYLDSQNRKQKKYNLTKDLTLTLISGYSIKLRKTIIDRWQELENQNNKPKTFEEIMKDALLLADQRVKQLEAQIEEDKPKVNFADAVWNTENCILMRDFCKMLNEKWVKIWQNRLYSWLRRKWYLMENNRPYQKYAHYFPVKERLINSCNWEMLQLTTYINWKWQAFLFTKLENEAEFK